MSSFSSHYTDKQRYYALGPSNYLGHTISQPFVDQPPGPQAWPQAPDSYLFGGAQPSSIDLLSSMALWPLSPPDALPPIQYNGGTTESHDHPSPDAACELLSPINIQLSSSDRGSPILPSLFETCYIHSWESDPSPASDFTHVECNAPLVAPVPLPCHSPTLMQIDLPDDDEDLSHTTLPHKRKREDDMGADELPSKRRGGENAVPIVSLAMPAAMTSPITCIPHWDGQQARHCLPTGTR
ncbi:hypothetical protein WOLCODRAFT_161438 [Wolfiporia cocos MD-104 SS10]|uniref:Uncharacterized protein n=1 Tax=Wolfiporia cocos (strain MD-104) TaxID=742152 RepID=A0A2H3JNP4_WOLCO|nr:hypothetical protein WOLCODRAFT_161438 [Wolfiporia cocos MD-104 SS10]